MADAERALRRALIRLVDELDRAAETGAPPEGWVHHIDCAEAARAIRSAMETRGRQRFPRLTSRAGRRRKGTDGTDVGQGVG